MIIHGKEDKSLIGVWNRGIEHLTGLINVAVTHRLKRNPLKSLPSHIYLPSISFAREQSCKCSLCKCSGILITCNWYQQH